MISYERLCEALDQFNRERRGEVPPSTVTPDAEAMLSPADGSAGVSDANELVIDDAPGDVASPPASPEDPVVDPAASVIPADAVVAVDTAYEQAPAVGSEVPVDPADDGSPGTNQGVAEQVAVQVDPAYVQEEPALESRVDGDAIPGAPAPLEGEATVVTGVPLEDPNDPTP